MPNKTDTNPIIERIQKLLALSQSSNEHEATTALAKAQALLTEHHLSQAEIEARTKTTSSYVREEYRVSSYTIWRRDLLTVLTTSTFCQLVFRNGDPSFSLVGEPVNIEAIKLLFALVEKQLQQFAQANYVVYRRSGGQEPTQRWKNAFYQGAIVVISRRLREERQTVEATFQNSQALVVLKEEQLSKAVTQFYPKARTLRSAARQIKAVDGYTAGQAAGKEVRLREELQAAHMPHEKQ